MSLGRTRFTAVALVATAAVALTQGGPADGKAKRKLKLKKVEMFDNYYSPAKLTVKKGQRVQWVWPSDVGDSHDVKVSKAPKGAKKFASPPFAAAAKWPRPPMKFKKAGTYKLYCTFHETEMTMTIIVKR